MAEENRRITEIVRREGGRLRNFILRRVPDPNEAEDILQDAFSELVAAFRLPMAIEQAGAWLFRVARNLMIDRARKMRPEPLPEGRGEDNADLRLDLLLPDPNEGPEALYIRRIILAELTAAIDELPPEQREVFVAHELEGKSFKELATASATSVNTLLARKRYAVLRLRERLQTIYDEYC